MRRVLLLVLGLGVLVGCGSDVEGGGQGGSGGSSGSGTASTSSGSGAVQCTGAMAMFPSFDKTCGAVTDCVTALHMVNCCGTLVALGIRASETNAFAEAEATCEMQYPGCGCAQSPTTTEDGKTSMDDSKIQVDCKNGQCMTFLP